MKTKSAILAIDQGTTGTRAILYDPCGKSMASSYREFTQYYPKPGWVEHDPDEIWHTVLCVIRSALAKAHLTARQIAAIGITNQRETTILWDRFTGKHYLRAIVWQDRRTAVQCEKLKQDGLEPAVRKKTGLVIDPYFSGSKLTWILNSRPLLRRLANKGDVLFGTVDSWLLWKLTGGRSHLTDFTNASRTLLFDIRKKKWDSELLKLFQVPDKILPRVCPSGFHFGETVKQGPLVKGIPICSVMGDQQAALFGQACYLPGEVKNTYGTGCFVVLNLGQNYRKPPFGLLATLACNENGAPVYAWEGSIFIAGAAIQWLRDGLSFFKHAKESEKFIRGMKDSEGVVFVPAFTGLGAPYWNSKVRGGIFGITRGTQRKHIIRAALESIAHQSVDVLEVMENQSQIRIHNLRVDGGATQNDFLMQFQADLAHKRILVSDIAESTAWGVAKLAGKMSGFWPHIRKIDQIRKYRVYSPRISKKEIQERRFLWSQAVHSLLSGVKSIDLSR